MIPDSRIRFRAKPRKGSAVLVDDDDDDDDDDDEDNDGDDDNSTDTNYQPHIKRKPDYVTLRLPVKFREDVALISNRRKEGSLRHQSEILSEAVLAGGGDLKDLPCSTTTMKK